MPLNGFPEQVKAVQIIILIKHILEFLMLYQLFYRVQVRYSPVLANKLIGHLCRIHRKEMIAHMQYDIKKG